VNIDVSMESEYINHEIVPPVIVNEGDDVQAYPSVQSAILDVEAIDVLKDVYTFHDSTGRILQAQVCNGEISLVSTSMLEPDLDSLRERILRALRLSEVSDEELSNAELSELSRLLLDKFENKK
jgi:hypothetical protein